MDETPKYLASVAYFQLYILPKTVRLLKIIPSSEDQEFSACFSDEHSILKPQHYKSGKNILQDFVVHLM